MKGVGIHCFAGGFTMGVKRVLPVVGQLELHDFGRETCEAHHTEFMNADSWEGWWDYRSRWKDCLFCYGNPRCTAFSSYSAGAGCDVRGPFAGPTRDIWDLCEFGIRANLDLISFESVQQCYTVGRELLDVLVGKLHANRYRVVHLFVNTAAEGNAQKRRRYFFVAYRNDRNFNVMMPDLPKYRTTVGDVLDRPEFQNRLVHEGKLYGKTNTNYDRDTYVNLSPLEKELIPYLHQGQSFNDFARNNENDLKRLSSAYFEKWKHRTSEIPFSLHSPTRLKQNGHCPTISSTSTRLIHPTKSRPLTVSEIAAMMGWPKSFIPVGPNPIGQIGKGVVPATGEWFAEQVKLYLENYWDDEDFESNYNHRVKRWIGNEFTKTNGPIEKVFRLTDYLPPFKETMNVL